MAENNYNNRNSGQGRNQQGRRGNRSRHGGGRGRSGGRSGGRPLLTSSTNAAGLSLVALVVSPSVQMTSLMGLLAVATISFCLSAIVSYFAQRMRGKWAEKLSDLLYLVGIVFVIVIAGELGGIWALLGL